MKDCHPLMESACKSKGSPPEANATHKSTPRTTTRTQHVSFVRGSMKRSKSKAGTARATGPDQRPPWQRTIPSVTGRRYLRDRTKQHPRGDSSRNTPGNLHEASARLKAKSGRVLQPELGIAEASSHTRQQADRSTFTLRNERTHKPRDDACPAPRSRTGRACGRRSVTKHGTSEPARKEGYMDE
jgi:hypothetical protein